MTDLHDRAAAVGLCRTWEDADGRHHIVADRTLDAILATLDTRSGERTFVSADVGTPVHLGDGSDGAATLTFEDGDTHAVAVAGGLLAPIDRPGYHTLRIGDRVIDLAIAPPRCRALPPGRLWGAAVQIPALRGDGQTAYGDLGTLADAARAFGAAGAAALAISPTHALFPADATRFSPYAPSSRLFHHALLAEPALVGVAAPGDAPARIDWAQALPARLAMLRHAFEAASPDVHARVAAARRERAELEAQARFDALHAHFFAQGGAKGWQDWPAAFHDPAGPAVARFAAEQNDAVTFYAFLQWLSAESLARAQQAARDAGMRVGLIADLAVGMDAGGAQAWSRRGDLLTGLSIGAPPDPLGPQGQNWGITALCPFAMRRTGFDAFIRTVRATLCHAGGIRIDHALGLKRLWVIPDGGTAADGAYLSMPFDDLLRILAIESHRADAVVIGEDLGTVPPGFREAMAARTIYGMRVLPFERAADGAFTDPAGWDACAVAMTGTHDTPTLAGWWTGRDITWAHKLKRSDGDEGAERVRRIGDRKKLWTAATAAGVATGPMPNDPAPAVDAALALTTTAACPLLIVPIEDLVGLEEQPNLPGTTDEHPNWRRRLPDTTAALLARPEVARRTALLSESRPA